MLSEAKQRALELRLRGGSPGASRPQDGAPPTITALDWDGPAPLSFAQQRLWFLHQLEEDSTAYNAPLALRLRGRLDEGALRAAAEAVVARHEILRTRLVALEGVPEQVVDPPGEFQLEVVDIGHSNDPARAADALVAQDEMVRFDLATGPLFRGRLIRIAPDDHVLSLVMHHLVTDEWSEGILRRELAALYAACAAGDPSPLPPLPVQYRDFARWQRDWLQGEALEDQLGYWRERLAGAAMLDLPTDRPRPPIRSSAGAVVDFEIPAEAVAGLRAVARDAGATTFMSALAAFGVVLGRHAGLDDVVVGTPVANRGRPEIEGLIGPVLNTLVLRTDLAGDPTFGELVSRVRQHALEAYARQDLPFEQLVEAIQPERDRSRTPLFQVLFNYEQADDDEPGLGGLEISEYADRRSTARFDLSLFLVESGGRMGGTLEYSTELFDRSTIERLARHLVALADAVARQPRRRLSELSLLGDAERRQVVDDWNRTRAPEPEETIHQQVARRAAQHPEATAVVYAGQAVSYSRLDQQANRLARHLQAKGVGPETVVGVCLDRGPELVVALLAVLKAGGTYLPLDPEHPPERLAFMLADSGATLVVGTRSGPQVPTELVALDDPDTAAAVAAAPADAPDGAIAGPDQLAYVMYTSGSTGRPKAVMVPHRGLTNRMAWMQDAYDLTVDDRVLHKTPSTFDVSLWELLWKLFLQPSLTSTAEAREDQAKLQPKDLEHTT